ncbi:MAG: ABC transporter ATP-binding protein [Treponema sp.]|nr:ABC transporter ATP-binding protein [Treponema sp.]
MSNTVIKAEHLSKYYQLGVINNGTLFRDIQTWLAIKRGKEDPHGKIGSHNFDGNADGFWALKDLNFEIKEGDRVGIIGKNGAGKSTLLKVLSRITAPTEGSVKIKGRVASLLEVGTGFHGELTGRENIYLNGAILGMKRKEVDRKIDEIIAFSEIEKHIDTPVKRYSSGMYVRLAFAVAAHLDSEILIADEVLAVGDAAFQKKALGKMNELSTGQGRTVLFVSHQMNAVKNLCNKGIVLQKGSVLFNGDLDGAIDTYLTRDVGTATTSYKEFTPDESKPFQMLSVHTYDENDQEPDVFETQKPIKIRMVYESRKPVPGLYGYFALKSSTGESIVIFDSNESEKDILSNLPVGKHTFEFTLPNGLLAPGKYIFYADFVSDLSDGSFHVDAPNECCMINVTDTLTIRDVRRGSTTSVIPKLVKLS